MDHGRGVAKHRSDTLEATVEGATGKGLAADGTDGALAGYAVIRLLYLLHHVTDQGVGLREARHGSDAEEV